MNVDELAKIRQRLENVKVKEDSSRWKLAKSFAYSDFEIS